jgi:hypothetical protein
MKKAKNCWAKVRYFGDKKVLQGTAAIGRERKTNNFAYLLPYCDAVGRNIKVCTKNLQHKKAKPQ